MRQEKNYRKPFHFINSAIFTNNNIPLAIDDTEKIVFFNPNASFILILGTGIPAYTARYNSPKGTVFITTNRLIYRPKNPTRHFDNFNISHDEILRAEPFFVEINVDNESFKASIDFTESQLIFFDVLNSQSKNVRKITAFDVANKDNLPLYCDVVKKEKNEENTNHK